MKACFQVAVCALVYLGSSLAMAVTTAQYFGMQGMINISNNHLGQTDSDAETLLADMNVPVQDSVMGPGKAITSEGQILNFICANRGSRNFTCTVIIQSSPHSKLSPNKMAYELSGEEAKIIHEKFHPNQEDGSYRFISTDGLFQVQSTPEHFLVIYQK